MELPKQECVDDFIEIKADTLELEYDNYEFYSFEEPTVFSPKGHRLKSTTENNILDDSQRISTPLSDYEEADEYLASSTPTPFSPVRENEQLQRLQCDHLQHVYPQDPSQVVNDAVQYLDQAFAQMPQLQRIEQGRVYNMEPILDALEDENEPARSSQYGLRNVERHDYKKLHHGKQ